MEVAQIFQKCSRGLYRSFMEEKFLRFGNDYPDWVALLKNEVKNDFLKNNLLSPQEEGALQGYLENGQYREADQLFYDCNPERYYSVVESFTTNQREDKQSLLDRKKAIKPPSYMESLKDLGQMQIGTFKRAIRGVVTTNFDLVLEYIFSDWEGLTWRDGSNLFEQRTGRQKQDNPRDFIFHIHGKIDQFESLIHTKAEYDKLDSDSETSAVAAKKFLEHLFTSYTILFVGYSLEDPIISWLKKECHCWSNHLKWYALTSKDDVYPLVLEESKKLELYIPPDNNSPKIQILCYDSGDRTEGLDKWFTQLHAAFVEFKPDSGGNLLGIVANEKATNIPLKGIIQYVEDHHRSYRIFDFHEPNHQFIVSSTELFRELFRQKMDSCIAILVIYRSIIYSLTGDNVTNRQNEAEKARLSEIHRYLALAEETQLVELRNKILIYCCGMPLDMSLSENVNYTSNCEDVVDFIVKVKSFKEEDEDTV